MYYYYYNDDNNAADSVTLSGEGYADLESLQTLGEVLVVDLVVVDGWLLLAQTTAAVDVEARALLYQNCGAVFAEFLLDEVLEVRGQRGVSDGGGSWVTVSHAYYTVNTYDNLIGERLWG